MLNEKEMEAKLLKDFRNIKERRNKEIEQIFISLNFHKRCNSFYKEKGIRVERITKPE